jgi:hypothetical protein
MATSGTTPDPPATPQAATPSGPHEPAADRATNLHLVAYLVAVAEVRRHLPVLEPFDIELDQRIRRRGGHGVRALCGVAALPSAPDTRPRWL